MRIKGQTFNTNPVTTRYSVSQYLEAMNEDYTNIYRKEWESLDNRWNAENKRWDNEIKRGWKDPDMSREHRRKHDETLKALKKEFAELAKKAEKGFNELITEADERFERHARPTGDKVDIATVELLKSGVLSDKEIVRLANDFMDNVAMRRIIGKYAKERAEKTMSSENERELSKLAILCNQNLFNYREPLESYANMAIQGLSMQEHTAHAYNKVLTEHYPEVLENAKSLYISEEYKGGNED